MKVRVRCTKLEVRSVKCRIVQTEKESNVYLFLLLPDLPNVYKVLKDQAKKFSAGRFFFSLLVFFPMVLAFRKTSFVIDISSDNYRIKHSG